MEAIPEEIENPVTKTQYSRGKLLGSGGFEKCYLFTDLSTRKKYAGKVIMKSMLKENLSTVYNATKIQMGLSHPNILRMLRYFYCTTYVCMILELCNASIGDILEELRILDEPSCRLVIREVARGISYLPRIGLFIEI